MKTEEREKFLVLMELEKQAHDAEKWEALERGLLGWVFVNQKDLIRLMKVDVKQLAELAYLGEVISIGRYREITGITERPEKPTIGEREADTVKALETKNQSLVRALEEARAALESGLKNLALNTNRSGSDPKAKTSGFPIAQMPEWQARQALNTINKALEGWG